MREVGIHDEEAHGGQKGQDTYTHSKVTGSSITIEHAEEVISSSSVGVALCCNGCKHHNGEHL